MTVFCNAYYWEYKPKDPSIILVSVDVWEDDGHDRAGAKHIGSKVIEVPAVDAADLEASTKVRDARDIIVAAGPSQNARTLLEKYAIDKQVDPFTAKDPFPAKVNPAIKKDVVIPYPKPVDPDPIF